MESRIRPPLTPEVGELRRRRVHVAADGAIDERPSDGAGVDDRLASRIPAVEPSNVAQHQLDAGRLRRPRHPPTTFKVEGQRFLTQDVQPSRRATLDILDVGGGAARYHHRIEPFGLQQVVDLLVNRNGAAAPADLVGPLGAGRRDRDEACAIARGGQGSRRGSDPSGPHRPPRSAAHPSSIDLSFSVLSWV